ncbi:MAG: tetratricopeptide repeat protein [Bacteroidales bacterium]|nr:tetratricopeptide repeat protein [Bacteroidales bacterium]MBQ2492300.1 tetratricopeptide repeat protein [Bacteroidales bacterium]MBQ4197144.1 tetratricopeptide repeat protein [Bacteroidales bacterium]
MEVENLTYKGISSLDVMEMEAMLKECPWFSFLRERLMEKLYSLDKEAFLQQLQQTAVFLSSRKHLYERINSPVEVEQEHQPEAEDVGREEILEPVQRPKVVVVGGDFFSKEDLKSIAPEEDMELKLRTSPFYRPSEEKASAETESASRPRAEKTSSLMTEDGKVNFDDLAFCTETLGHIYAQQGFYDKAIEVFSKLILLYPQKSAYFAALVNDLKNNID